MAGDDGTDPFDVRRRSLISVCTAHYEAERAYPALEKVPDELAVVRDWLCSDGLGERRFVHLGVPLDSRLSAVRQAFVDEDERSKFRPGDAVVVYASGHGEFKRDGGHRLVLTSSDPDQPSTTLQTARIVEWLKATVDHALVVIDTCYSGQTLADLSAYGELPDGWLVLTTAGKTAKAGQLVFAEALSAYLSELRTAGPHGPVEPYLDATTFVAAIRQRMHGRARLLDHGYARPGPSPCLPNPVYDPAAAEQVATSPARADLALPRADLDAHWGPRARGVTAAEVPGWFFTGRAPVVRRLVAALSEPPALVVVSGRAGSGKSAVLSRLVTFADPAFVDEHADLVAAVPADQRPAVGSVDVAVVASGKRTDDVVAQIATALGLGDLHRPADLQRALLSRQEPVTVVVDAVDESPEPERVAELVSDLGSTGRVRMVVGMRSVATGSSEEDRRPLRVLLQGWQRHEVVSVDEEPWWSEADLAGYARELLLGTDGTPYDEGAAGPLAEAVARGASRSFLLVRLAASALARDPVRRTATDPEVVRLLDGGVRAVFAEELRQCCSEPAERRRAVDLLGAASLAAGAGVPWHGVWPRMATAVATARGRPNAVYGDADVAWLLGSRLGGYLARALRDDVTVYRPFHEALGEILRGSPDQLDDGGTLPLPGAHARVVEALLPHVRGLGPASRVVTVPRYVRRHLVDHALSAGTLPALLDDVDVLLVLRRGAAVLAASRTDDERLSTLLLRLAELDSDTVGDRAAVAELRAHQLRLDHLAEQLGLRAARSPWRAAWADWAAPVASLGLWRGTVPVTAVEAEEVAGSAYVVVGCRDGRVLGFDGVWDPRPQPDLDCRLDASVWALALTSDGDGPLVAAATSQGEVALVRPRQGVRRLSTPWDHPGVRVSALRFARVGPSPGRLVLLVGGYEDRLPQGDGPRGLVHCWDVEAATAGSGSAVHRPQVLWQQRRYGAPHALGLARLDDEPVVVAAGDTIDDPGETPSATTLFRLADGQVVAEQGPSGYAAGAAPVPGEQLTYVVSETYHRLHLLTPAGIVDRTADLDMPRSVTVVPAPAGAAGPLAVAATSLGLTVVPVVLGSDGPRFGDVAPQLRLPWVAALAAATDAGRPLLVAGGHDGRVLVIQGHRLLPGDVPPDPSLPKLDGVSTTPHWVSAAPQPHAVVTAPSGGRLRSLDTYDGSVLAQSSEQFAVRWLAAAEVRGARRLLVSGGGRPVVVDASLQVLDTLALERLPEQRAVHPFVHQGRQLLAVGEEHERLSVVETWHGSLVASGRPSGPADKAVLAVTSATVRGRTVLLAASNRAVTAFAVPEHGLPAGGSPAAVLPVLHDPLVSHDDHIRCLAVLPGPVPVLASGGDDAMIALTRLEDGARLADVQRPHGDQGVSALAVVGSLLVSAGYDGAVRLWALTEQGTSSVATIPVDAPVLDVVEVGGRLVVATELGLVGVQVRDGATLAP